MATNLSNADSALKTVYLEALNEQLNQSVSPFLAAIEKTSNHVWGKEVSKTVVHGINGGIGAGNEDGSLPVANGNTYTKLTSTLKNLYGVIEVSDKAVRASENNAGALVNILNAEMEGLLKASKFNLGRMLFGDGSGTLSTILEVTIQGYLVSDVTNFVEGMVVDFRKSYGTIVTDGAARRITKVDRENSKIVIDGTPIASAELPAGSIITMQNSYQKEITGLKAIFNNESSMLYGNSKTNNSLFSPYSLSDAGEITESKIQIALDDIEERSGNSINFIICSWGVRRALQKVLAASRQMTDTMELAGGYKAMSYNGIPIVVDRFCPKGTMYLLNTNDFALHQLCDWQWLADDDGKILRQVPGKPVYTATLVKYADLICSRPCGQGVITGITEE